LEARRGPPPGAADCWNGLTTAERRTGIAARFRFDDAIRGWGYTPLYEPAAPSLWREAQKKNDTSYRCVAVRDEACVYRRLVGFAVHETIHALEGDTREANYGIPFGLPYGVPADVPEGAAKEYLQSFNIGEARALVGVEALAGTLIRLGMPT